MDNSIGYEVLHAKQMRLGSKLLLDALLAFFQEREKCIADGKRAVRKSIAYRVGKRR